MSNLFRIFAKQNLKVIKTMRKLIFGLIMGLSTLTFAQSTNTENVNEKVSYAKEATQEGNVFVGVDASNVNVTNIDGNTSVNVGATVGIFAKQDLAVVGTLGYRASLTEAVNTNDWYYGVGLRYYIEHRVPVQVDWRGSTSDNMSTSYVGFEGGYAFFPFKNFSIEPKLRYDLSTKDEFKNIFGGKVGFNLFF